MSDDNAGRIQRMMDDFVRGDYEAAIGVFAEDVEGDFTHMPEGRMTHGHEQLRSEIARWAGTWKQLTTEVERIQAQGDKVLLLVRQSGIGKGSGAPMEMRYGQVFTLRDGEIVAMKTYLDRARAAEAAGIEGST
jgi:ketosteroid isomerase-like protein